MTTYNLPDILGGARLDGARCVRGAGQRPVADVLLVRRVQAEVCCRRNRDRVHQRLIEGRDRSSVGWLAGLTWPVDR